MLLRQMPEWRKLYLGIGTGIMPADPKVIEMDCRDSYITKDVSSMHS